MQPQGQADVLSVSSLSQTSSRASSRRDSFLRRDFLRTSASAIAWGLFGTFANPASAKEHERFRGIFPIVQTPYTKDNKVAFAELEKEVRFLDRTGVHGIVWPQRASEYPQLSFEERIEGAERIVRANEGLRPAVVIGVQGPDTATAVKYAKHAQKLQPDAIIALPSRDQRELDLNEVADYYAAIARACSLPMFVQTTGNMSVDFVTKMARDIPTLRFAKDEAGNTLTRIAEFKAKGGERPVKVFTGGHGQTLIDEMMRGAAGNMPAAGWVDLYVKVWDHWHAGNHDKALDLLSKIMLFVTQARAYGIPALNYVLHLRGVFSNWKARSPGQGPLDDLAQLALRNTYEFVKPHFTA